jgi:hypothetical protein
LTAFGGGLTWGSTVLRWPELAATEQSGQHIDPSQDIEEVPTR